MMTSGSFDAEGLAIDLDREDLEEEPDEDAELEEPTEPTPAPSILERLETYRILPPEHALLSERVLLLIEQLFFTWYDLADDAARRAALPYLLGNEAELRTVLLAVVPLYFDRLFFDASTPTRDLVEIILVAHARWRRWLASV